MGEEAGNASVDHKGKKKNGVEVPKGDTKKNSHVRKNNERQKAMHICTSELRQRR